MPIHVGAIAAGAAWGYLSDKRKAKKAAAVRSNPKVKATRTYLDEHLKSQPMMDTPKGLLNPQVKEFKKQQYTSATQMSRRRQAKKQQSK